MTFFADEGLDAPLVLLLRSMGHEVQYALETIPGVPDEMIVREAAKENAVLLTKDKDFGSLIVRSKMQTAGVVLIRTEKLNDPVVLQQCANLIDRYSFELLNRFSVVDGNKIRIRSL